MKAYRLTEEDLTGLDVIATKLGLFVKGHGYTGRPNQTAAIQALIKEKLRQFERREKKEENSLAQS